ncbi:MAG TPA: prolyl oligopeptidase family serine peptidase [Vicinamibacterales bacterium]|nr:prolyl oligopeptidase family serine peptidase [Vicinamibacterales bacterium]
MIRIRMRGILGLSALALVAALAATPALEAQAQSAAPQKPAAAAQAPAADTQPAANGAPKTIELDDILAWKGLGAATLSNNGQWIAYRVSPLQGDSEVIIRNTANDTEYKVAVGEGFGGATVFSDDSAYAAVSTTMTRKAAQAARRARRPIQTGVTIIKLADGTKTEVAKIRRFAFSGETPGWIALHRYGADAAAGGPALPAAGGPAVPPPPGGRGAGPAAPSSRPRGTDLILRDLATGDELSLGNVADFQFDKSGRWLAYTIDAADQAGNGLQLRDMTAGTVRVLDSGKAWYERPTWTEKGDALAVLKGREDRAYRDRLHSVVGFTGFSANAAPTKVTFDPSTDKSFPAGMTISPNRSPSWTDDLDALIFGIHELRKSDRPSRPEPAEGEDAPAAPATPPAAPPAADDNADEKPNLVIWHWKDPRLQSQQEVQQNADRNYSYVSIYYPATQKFIRLADDELRTVNIAPKDKWAVGYDVREYQRMGNLDGRQFRDVYTVNLATGERKLALRKNRWIYGPSPDGTKVLFYQDKHFHVLDLTNGQTRNITASVPANFVNIESDVNVVDPPRNPWGFSSDSRFVVLNDGFDVWQVPVAQGTAVNLTVNGTRDGIRHRTRFSLDPDERGIDLSKPLYVDVYGEWTKKQGFGRIDPGKPGVKNLTWDDAMHGRLMKARKADVIVYSRETRAETPNFHVTTMAFGPAKKISDVYPDQKNFAWSGDAMLLDYTSEKGRKLQGSLFLPANYEKGKQYPMVVYIYERLTQGHNTYARPTSNGFNRSVYTSNGYAVLMPDITYHVNDPGMSAVWSVVPAVKAALATGIVDPKNVGIQGHSWGGYQTSFLVTQTDIFTAAVAGAPLTNMISMYGLIYKNSGVTNGMIFEASQGRFTSGYNDNWEAYARNSPVYHAQNVKTPLMILHNDLDGAVDFTQGIEYFNALRRMDKPVILLEYPGENHGLARPANQQDYTVRMKEWFDHYLKDAPAPDWMLEGIPRLKMEEHINERLKARKKTEPAKTTPPAKPGGGL